MRNTNLFIGNLQVTYYVNANENTEVRPTVFYNKYDLIFDNCLCIFVLCKCVDL